MGGKLKICRRVEDEQQFVKKDLVTISFFSDIVIPHNK